MDTTARFALVGPGRAGTAITEALVQAGWRLSAVAGRSADAPSARALADRHHAAARPVAAVAAGADVVVVATPDAALAAAAAALAPSLAPGTLVVHLAGSLGLEVFDDLLAARRDTAVGAAHPLQTLPAGTTPDRLRGVAFAVEGDERVVALVEAVGGRPFAVADRVAYHAAACVAGNHLVALVGQVERLAASAGLPADAFAPLMRTALDNALEHGAAASLTGPVVRGDATTVARHLDGIPGDERAAYRALAIEALRLADDPDPAVRAVLDGLLVGGAS